MLKVAVGLLLAGALELAACGLLIGPPWKHRDKLVAWLLSALGSAVLLLLLLLVASTLHLHLPLVWLGVAILAGLDAAVAWVLVLLVRARGKARRD